MWFKNLLIYRFTKPFTLTAEEVNTKLAEKSFAPCNSQDVSSYGWAMPLGNQGSEYIHATNGCIMICAQKQDKILPASVVNDVLADKIEEIKEAEDRIPGRKERTHTDGGTAVFSTSRSCGSPHSQAQGLPRGSNDSAAPRSRTH